MNLKTNVPVWDRWIRGAAGSAALSLLFWGPKSAWGLLGLVPLVTAFVGFCPAYTLLRSAARRPGGA